VVSVVESAGGLLAGVCDRCRAHFTELLCQQSTLVCCSIIGSGSLGSVGSTFPLSGTELGVGEAFVIRSVPSLIPPSCWYISALGVTLLACSIVFGMPGTDKLSDTFGFSSITWAASTSVDETLASTDAIDAVAVEQPGKPVGLSVGAGLVATPGIRSNEPRRIGIEGTLDTTWPRGDDACSHADLDSDAVAQTGSWRRLCFGVVVGVETWYALTKPELSGDTGLRSSLIRMGSVVASRPFRLSVLPIHVSATISSH
jgi:hypothetical protein